MKNNTRRTTRQKIFLYIKKEIDKNGYLPSLRQIGKAVGLASPSSVKRHVDILESEGWIPAKHTDSAEKAYTEVPIYTEKQLSEQRFSSAAKERLYLPYRQPNDGLFAIRVPDNALSEIGIRKDDFVIAEKRNDIESGDPGVFLLHGRVYIRTFRLSDEGFVLASENDAFEKIDCKEFTLLGKIIAVQRFF